MRARGRETTTHAQEIRKHKHHKNNCTDDPSIPTADGALSPTGTRKIPRLWHVASSLYLLHLPLADSKSKPFYQRCPVSQPLLHRKKLNKAGIGVRTRRHYPARTSVQMLSHPHPPPPRLPECCQTGFHLPGKRWRRSPNQWSTGKKSRCSKLRLPKEQPSQITLQ